MDKLTKKMIRIWILIASTAIFIVGWVTIAHEPKAAAMTADPPEQSISVSVPALDPVPSLEELTQGTGQLTFSQPAITLGMPRLRTRGS